MKNILLSLCILIGFTACSKVNVVLLPEENNKVGQIKIESEKKTFTVDKAYQQVNAEDGDSTILSQEAVQKKFKDSINALPSKPLSYLLYFKWDSSDIMNSSEKVLQQVIEKAKENSTFYIDIIGHTDRAGEKEYNRVLSLKRANNIKNILLKNAISEEKIHIDYYGESTPIVQTADGVAKSINRRVEVIIK